MSRGNVKYFLAVRKNKFAIVKDLCYNVPNRIGGAVMTTKQIIEMALAYKDMSKVELADKMGWSRQVLNARVNTGKFSAEEWEAFGQALGASVQITFTFTDGTVVGKQ